MLQFVEMLNEKTNNNVIMEICLVVLEAVLKMQVMIANKIPINFQYVCSRMP